MTAQSLHLSPAAFTDYQQLQNLIANQSLRELANKINKLVDDDMECVLERLGVAQLRVCATLFEGKDAPHFEFALEAINTAIADSSIGRPVLESIGRPVLDR